MNREGRFILFTSFLLSLAVALTIFLFSNNNESKPYANSSRFLIEEYSLTDILNKVKNKKYDKITKKDKTKIKNLINIYSKGKYKEVCLTEEDWLGNNITVTLKEFLKYGKKEHNSISANEEQLRYLVALYKIVIDDDRSYIQDLDDNFYKKEQKKESFSISLLFSVVGFVIFFFIFCGLIDSILSEGIINRNKILGDVWND